MAQVARSWVAFAAIGAAVIHLALVIGSPPPLAVAMALLGVAEFGWGIASLSRDRMLVPRVAVAVAVVPLILWSLAVVLSAALKTGVIVSELPLFPLAVAGVFQIVAAIVITRQLRADAAADPDRPVPPAARRHLLGMVVGALVVAALTAPALAVTQAGANDRNGSQYFSTDHSGH